MSLASKTLKLCSCNGTLPIDAKRLLPCSLIKVQMSQVAGDEAALEWLSLGRKKAQGLLVAVDSLRQVARSVACGQLAVGSSQVVLGQGIPKRSGLGRIKAQGLLEAARVELAEGNVGHGSRIAAVGGMLPPIVFLPGQPGGEPCGSSFAAAAPR